MIDGTPDVESVRDAWALMYPDHEYGEAVEKFDRWLDSVKAEVWNERHRMDPAVIGVAKNPYRTEK